MKNKIIIVDLDGTVLHSDESITNYTIDAIKMCQRRGAKIVVATSRSRKSAKKYYDLLTPDALITCGGATAVVGDKIIHEALLDSKLAKTYIKKCLPLNDVDFIRVSGELEDYTNNPQLISGEMEYGHYKKTSFDLTVEQRVEKITICSKNITEVEKIFGCDSHCALVLSYAGECFHKLTHAEATKESALKKILSYWGSNNEHCIAFGNDDADINMLLMCGIGVAVRNATKNLKSIADIICEDNDNDGVASYLMEYYSQLKAK